MKFSEKLKETRMKKKLTQLQASEKIGVSKRTLEYWEKNQRIPPEEKNAITQERVLKKLDQ